MTTDDYTTAARAEAQRAYQDTGMPRYDLAVHMAEWARAYLTQQEPADAEVEAAARALWDGERGLPWDGAYPIEHERYLNDALTALRAARDVRGQA